MRDCEGYLRLREDSGWFGLNEVHFTGAGCLGGKSYLNPVTTPQRICPRFIGEDPAFQRGEATPPGGSPGLPVCHSAFSLPEERATG